MNVTELGVGSEEQVVYLQNGYTANIRFDMIYKRWFYDLYNGDELVYAGIALTPNTAGLLNISDVSLGVIDTVGDKEQYEPYSELGARLMVVEITE